MKQDKGLQKVAKITNCKEDKQFSSYVLTKKLLDKSAELELSATAISVLLALLHHYNPAHKYVFPHQETIAKRIKRSVATVKRAVAELKSAGFILTSKTRKGNLYAFTQKLFDTLESPLCTVQRDNDEPSMYSNKQINKKDNKQADIVVSENNFSKGVDEETSKEASSTAVSVSSETCKVLSFEAIPDILKRKAETGEIKNLKGYWRSLRPQIKQQYIDLDREEKSRLQKQLEQAKQREKEKLERAEAERKAKEEIEKPLHEQFTREQVISNLWRLRTMHKGELHGFWKTLVEYYNLDIQQICKAKSEADLLNL